MNRDYSPAIGRYVQSDPIGISGGKNVYAYASFDPVSFFDSRGLSVEPCCEPKMSDEDCCNTIPVSESGNYILHGAPGAAATVMCCQGRSITCVSRIFTRNKPGDHILLKCVKVHEDFHNVNHVEPCPANCSYYVNPFKPGKDPHDGECEAYAAHERCLRDGLHECGGDKMCELRVRSEIGVIKGNKEVYKCPL